MKALKIRYKRYLVFTAVLMIFAVAAYMLLKKPEAKVPERAMFVMLQNCFQ